MKFLLLALLILVTPAFAAGDPCLEMVPPALRQQLLQRFPNERLPLTVDTLLEDRPQAIKGRETCLLVARADIDGDGRTDMMLLLPSRKQHGYRLVAAHNLSNGWKVTSLFKWKGTYDHMYVAFAAPGDYRHTDAYAFIPAPGAVEQIVTRHPGFFFGEIEAAADAYFLDKGRWVHVHSID